MRSDNIRRKINNLELGLCRGDQIVLDEMKTTNLLTVHVKIEDQVFVVRVEAEDVALNIPKSN